MTNAVTLFRPEVGKEICFPPTDYNYGGLGTIGRVEKGVSAGKEVPFVTCKEAPGLLFNYTHLMEKQVELRKQYGKSKACSC